VAGVIILPQMLHGICGKTKEEDMSKESFAGFGIWKLLSCELQDDDGSIYYPYGKNVSGLVVLDARGCFSAHVLSMNRPNFRAPDPLGGTQKEIEAAFRGYIGYYGTFTIDKAKGIIITHVNGASFPNWIGSDQVRHYESHGDRMTLSTPPMLAGGKKRVAKLIWERLA
jgi:hypothetical protein